MAMPVYVVIAAVGAIDLGTNPSDAAVAAAQSAHSAKPVRVVR